MYAELVFMEPISAHGKTRRDLARQAELAIADALDLTPHPRESGNTEGLQPVAVAPELAAA
jgi:hypothetical protein